MKNLEKKIKSIISSNNFSSNENVGFSCYIPDGYPFKKTEGLLLWNYSRTHRRIETQIQKFHSKARISRMYEIFHFKEGEYEELFSEILFDYLRQFKSIPYAKELKGRIKLFKRYNLRNIVIPFDELISHSDSILQLEQITVSNKILEFYKRKSKF